MRRVTVLQLEEIDASFGVKPVVEQMQEYEQQLAEEKKMKIIRREILKNVFAQSKSMMRKVLLNIITAV